MQLLHPHLPRPARVPQLVNAALSHAAPPAFSVTQKLLKDPLLFVFHSAAINTRFDSICSILQLVSCNCLALETVLSEQVRQIINKFRIAPCILSKFETFLIRCLSPENLVQWDNCNLDSLSSPFVLFPPSAKLQSCTRTSAGKLLENKPPKEI